MSLPTTTHFRAATRLLCYLKGNPGRGLLFRRDSECQLLGFSDADWGRCPDTRRSISGFCFFLGNSLVSWRSKKQVTVSRSSSEAEYRALVSATCELQWLSYRDRDLHLECFRPRVLYCDNQSALHIAANPVFHEQTKYLDIDCHIVREKSQNGLMRLLPISSSMQVADLFTKSLTLPMLRQFFPKLGLVDIYQPPACGGLKDYQHQTDSSSSEGSTMATSPHSQT